MVNKYGSNFMKIEHIIFTVHSNLSRINMFRFQNVKQKADIKLIFKINTTDSKQCLNLIFISLNRFEFLDLKIKNTAMND